MAEVLLFHHAQGLTPGVRGRSPTSCGRPATSCKRRTCSTDAPSRTSTRVWPISARRVSRRCGSAASGSPDGLPAALVYAGFSFGVLPAQKLAQTRPGARGALLFHACLPISGAWALGPWPDGVPVQIHGMDADPFFVGEGDIEAAREIVATVEGAELFLYAGDRHYFADSSLPSYDPSATALLTRRVLEFLDRV